MIDQSVQQLLEEAVDSPVKLQLLLLFHENPTMQATPSQVVSRVCRDMWSTDTALRELADDGILGVMSCHHSEEPLYIYQPSPEHEATIARLVRYFADPLKRDLVHASVRDIARYAPYRRERGWFATSL
jgi:hypothetical protein